VAVKVGVVLAVPGDDVSDWLADAGAYEAAGADLLWVDAGADLDPMALAAALAVASHRALIVVADGPVDPAALQTVQRLGRGRFRLVNGSDEVDGERWLRAGAPPDRAALQAALADATERDAAGVIVEANPRLLDMLRNPEEPGGRSDLHLSMG
jgi:hypothetical protein